MVKEIVDIWDIKVASFEADTWDLFYKGKRIATFHDSEINNLKELMKLI